VINVVFFEILVVESRVAAELTFHCQSRQTALFNITSC